jgi:hypothetical protein
MDKFSLAALDLLMLVAVKMTETTTEQNRNEMVITNSFFLLLDAQSTSRFDINFALSAILFFSPILSILCWILSLILMVKWFF